MSAEFGTAIGQVPPIVLMIGLMLGPTLLWIAYRLVRSPGGPGGRSQSQRILWICDQCQTTNTVRDRRCHRCGFDRALAGGSLRVIDHDAVVALEQVERVAPVEPASAAAVPTTVDRAWTQQVAREMTIPAEMAPGSFDRHVDAPRPTTPATASPAGADRSAGLASSTALLIAVGPGSSPVTAAAPPVPTGPEMVAPTRLVVSGSDGASQPVDARR